MCAGDDEEFVCFAAKNGWLDGITKVDGWVLVFQVEVAGCTGGTLGRLIYEPKLASINEEEEKKNHY